MFKFSFKHNVTFCHYFSSMNRENRAFLSNTLDRCLRVCMFLAFPILTQYNSRSSIIQRSQCRLFLAINMCSFAIWIQELARAWGWRHSTEDHWNILPEWYEILYIEWRKVQFIYQCTKVHSLPLQSYKSI